LFLGGLVFNEVIFDHPTGVDRDPNESNHCMGQWGRLWLERSWSRYSEPKRSG
jgi:hypothetical protein